MDIAGKLIQALSAPGESNEVSKYLCGLSQYFTPIKKSIAETSISILSKKKSHF
jgi:hypothetical protein